jgi:alkylation response protein AidB-like acyl-CoA dehydrogenase
MDFSLTDEQLMFRDMFRDFAQKEVAKVAVHIDEAEEPPRDLLKKAAAQGFLAAMIPEDFGGAALDPLSYALLLEEIAKVCMSTAVTLAAHNSFVASLIVKYGNNDQKERWLPKLAESLGAWALTEPDAGTDTSHLATRAKLDGEAYVIDGVKTWVSNGGTAETLLVVAQTTHGPAVLAADSKTNGIKIGYREPTMGLRGVAINMVYFDHVCVPAIDRIGSEGEGLAIARAAITNMQLAVAALSLGCAEGAFELGKQFAVERKQFGVAIATKQALGNTFADTEIDVEALRHLIEHTAWLAGQGQAFKNEAVMARMFGAKVAREAANRMLQVHGGYGFSDEYAISRIYRDARALDFIGGTPQIGRVMIAQQVFESTGVTIRP